MSTSGVTPEHSSYDEDMGILNQDEPVIPDDKDEEEEEHDPEVVTEDEEEEEEEEEEDDQKSESDKDEEEEEEEEEEPVKILFDRPTMKDIKEKYPSLFKDFPVLRDAFFREAQFTQIFPTIEDAKEAVTDAQLYGTLRDSVLEGNSETLLKSIDEADKKSTAKFARQFLPTLFKHNSELYAEAINPLLESVARKFYKSGSDKNDENIQNAALLLSEFLFDTDGVAKGEKTFVKKEAEESEEAKQLRMERQSLERQKFVDFRDEISTTIQKSLKQLILKDFDPDRSLTVFMRRKAVEEIISRVGKQLEADKGHLAVMDSRWKSAKRLSYKGDSKDKIVTAYLARAKSLLPLNIDKIRKRVFGASEKDAQQREDKITRRSNDRQIPVGRGGREGAAPIDRSKIDWTRTSDEDFLNDRITYRSK